MSCAHRCTSEAIFGASAGAGESGCTRISSTRLMLARLARGKTRTFVMSSGRIKRTPNTKTQTPEKPQTSKSSGKDHNPRTFQRYRVSVEIWSLVLLWCLLFGIWRFLRFAENQFEQSFSIAEIRNHDVCADPHQALALPFVHAARPVIRLVAGNGNRQATNLLCVFDFDVAIAKRKQSIAGHRILPQNPLDHHLLGKTLVIIERAVNVRAKILHQPQQ